jgi:hypothetical protein
MDMKNLTPEQLQYLMASLESQQLLPKSEGRELQSKELSKRLAEELQNNPDNFRKAKQTPFEYGGESPVVSTKGTQTEMDELSDLLESGGKEITKSDLDSTKIRNIQDLLDMPEGMQSVPEGTASRNIMKEVGKQSSEFEKANRMKDLIESESDTFNKAQPSKIGQFEQAFKSGKSADLDALTSLKKGGKLLKGVAGKAASVIGAPLIGDILMPEHAGAAEGSPEEVLENPSASVEARKQAMEQVKNKYIRGEK